MCKLLWCVNKKYKTTYESEFDTMPVWNAVPGLLVLAMCVHSHTGKSFFSGTLLAFSVWVDAVALLPQYCFCERQVHEGAIRGFCGSF